MKYHLSNYKDFITSSNKPYGLHRPRQEKYFNNKKIIFKGMFKSPEFYIDNDKYYYGFSFSSIIENNTKSSLEYLLAILNSKYANHWFYSNGKLRGAGVDIGVEKLRTFPIPLMKSTTVFEILVNYILTLNMFKDKINQNVPNSHIVDTFEEVVDAMVFELYFPTEFAEAGIEFFKYVERDFISIDKLDVEQQKEIIHEGYQKLREKTNEIRNNIKLMKIELHDLLMPILTV